MPIIYENIAICIAKNLKQMNACLMNMVILSRSASTKPIMSQNNVHIMSYSIIYNDKSLYVIIIFY